MTHRPETRYISRCCMAVLVASAAFWPGQVLAQAWPAPPTVSGNFQPQDLALAETVETPLACDEGDASAYCSDPQIQVFRQRLLEAVAAKMHSTRGQVPTPDPSLGHVSGFHTQLKGCGGDLNQMVMCSGSAQDVRNWYWFLADFPDESVTGEACATTVEKACVVSHLSDRIAAWSPAEDSDPGFDCSRRTSAALQTVCRDGELSARHKVMIERLSELPEVGNIRELPGDRAELLTDAYWYTSTYDCQENRNCIRAKIEERIRAIAAISDELRVAAAQSAAREIQLAEERRLEELAAARDQLALQMDGIINDAVMPAAAFFHEPEDIRSYERAITIAEIEEELSDLARREGRVYRGLWFWSQFRDPKAMRTVFRGNRTVPFTAEDGAIYFHNGYPLERGHSDQIGILTGWVRAYASMCGHLLPQSADELRIETLTTSGPFYSRTTRLTSTDVLRFQNGLMRPYQISRRAFQDRQQEAFQQNLWGNAFDIMSGGLSAASDMARSQIGPYLYALDDFTQFLTAVGCDSPTARQMSQGIALVASGQSLSEQATGASIAGAAWVSDTPQKVGEMRLHSEICWNYEVATTHNVCGCLLNIAKERLGESNVISASVPYRDVHEAFMHAPELQQRLCRDPLGAISAGLLSIE